MPPHVLTPQERRAYATIPGDVDEPSQWRFFVLSAADERLMNQVRGPHNRLGLAHHLGWLRWLGRQPGRDEVQSGPGSLTVFLAWQLNVAPEAFEMYPRDRGAWSHHLALAASISDGRRGATPSDRCSTCLVSAKSGHSSPVLIPTLSA